MKKYLLNFLLFFFFSIGLFAINIKIENLDGRTIVLTDTKIMLQDSYEEAFEEYNIKWETHEQLNYIIFNYTGNNIYIYPDIIEKHGEKKYLVLYSWNFISLYNENNKLVYINYKTLFSMLNDFSVKASSELKEKNIIYKLTLRKEHKNPIMEVWERKRF